jgi:hypothetical protein
MPQNLEQKLLAEQVVSGTQEQGSELRLRIEQTLTQDATCTLVMLELTPRCEAGPRSSALSMSTTTCCRRISRIPTTTCSC